MLLEKRNMLGRSVIPVIYDTFSDFPLEKIVELLVRGVKDVFNEHLYSGNT